MVHFYDEISDEELYRILTHDLGDIEDLLGAMTAWVVSNSRPVAKNGADSP